MPIVGSRNGNINVTQEKITVWSTVGGALLITALRILLRLVILLPLGFMAILTGRLFGPLLLFGSLSMVSKLNVRSIIPPSWTLHTKELTQKEAKQAFIIALLGLLFMWLWIADLWPAVSWDIGGGFLWVSHPWGSTGFAPVWLWVRLGLIALIPWACTRPMRVLDWVLEVENTFPKFREVGFAPASVTSKPVATVDGDQLTPATNQQQSIKIKGNKQIPNAPDETVLVQVDGV